MEFLSLSLIAVILIVAVFDFSNGFHDAADMIATAIACSGWIRPVPTAKRSVTHAMTRPVICHKQWELDIKARLEKRMHNKTS